MKNKILQKALRALFDKKETTFEECGQIIEIWKDLNLCENGLQELINDRIVTFEL